MVATLADTATPGPLLAAARRRAGLTQAQLARRLAISQAAVAQLERPDANPRLATLDRALRALGAELVLDVRPHAASVDESLIRGQLALSAPARLDALERAHQAARELERAGRAGRGEPA